jgi:hypothetical protein
MSGVFYLDGTGNISVAATSSPLGSLANVGTYVVNTDCTINVSLTDVFNTATPPGITTPMQGSASLVGLVLSGGAEVDLSAPQSPASTNGNTPLVSGELASRLSIQMIRSFPYGCDVTNLVGAYGLIGSGNAVVAAGTQPATFFARLLFDGNGNVVPDLVVPGSPLATLQFTGTYTENLDCSGTMAISPAGAAATTQSTVNFVLIPPVAYVANGTATLTGNAARPDIQFTLSSKTQTQAGYGRAQ